MTTQGKTMRPLLLDQQTEGGTPRVARAEIIEQGTGKTTLWERATQTCSSARIGTWTGEPGLLTVGSYPNDEVFVVTSGHIRLHDSSGLIDVRPGVGAFVPKGWSGKWENVEPSAKVFVILSNASETDA